MNKIILLLGLLVLLLSCDDTSTEIAKYEPQLVVEGRIDNDSYASVLLSWSAPLGGALDTVNLLNHIIKEAKVSVSNGNTTEVLLLRRNNNKIPPYEYITTQMKGVVGETYTLCVEYEGKQITGTTTIPEPIAIDSLWFKKKNESDNFGYIHIAFNNSSNYDYQISTQVSQDEKVFTPCLYGNIENSLYPKGEKVLMQINKGPIIFPEASYVTYFADNKTVIVRLCTQTKESYEFWTSYQNEVLNSQNPIFPSTSKLKSNIVGGIGVWGGYGSSFLSVSTTK